MAVAIQAPQRKEKRDPVDTIIKGLQVAGSIYGIKEASDKAKALELAKQQDAKAQQFTQATKEAELNKEGFQKQVGPDGQVSFLRPPGFQSLSDQKTQAEIAKLKRVDVGERNENSWKSIPKDKQIQVEKLAGKISDRQQISNDIQAALKQLEDPKLSEDLKITVGRELLKTLNSSQGADAIGSEEAKRLGSLLEFKIGNFTQPGSFVGRDIGMFTDQVRNNSKRLQESLGSSQSQIDQMMGRRGSSAISGGNQFAGQNSPRSGLKLPGATPSANAADSGEPSLEDLMAEKARRAKK